MKVNNKTKIKVNSNRQVDNNNNSLKNERSMTESGSQPVQGKKHMSNASLDDVGFKSVNSGDINMNKTNDNKEFKNMRNKTSSKQSHQPELTGELTSKDIHYLIDNANTLGDQLYNGDVKLSSWGAYPAGVEINQYYLTEYGFRGLLPIIGKPIHIKNLYDKSIGKTAYFSTYWSTLSRGDHDYKLKEALNRYKDDIRAMVALQPSLVKKTITHNYAMLSDSMLNKFVPVTEFDNQYMVQLNNIWEAFQDSYGTDFTINRYNLKRGSKLESREAFMYMTMLYDIFTLNCLTLSDFYTQFISSIQYSTYISTTLNNYYNKIIGAVFRSSTFTGKFASTLTSLGPLNLPFNYYNFMIKENFTISKPTSGRATGLSITNSWVKTPTEFLDIYDNESNVIITKEKFKALFSSIEIIPNIFSYEEYKNNAYTNKAEVSYRSDIVNKLQTVSTAIFTFYDLFNDLLTAQDRAIESGALTFYTSRNTQDNGIKAFTLLNANKHTESGGLMRLLNYLSVLNSAPNDGGCTIKAPLIPSVTFSDLVTHSDLLLFIGEQNLYHKAFDVDGDVEVFLNNITDNHIIMSKETDKSAPTSITYKVKINGDKDVDLPLDLPLLNTLVNQYFTSINFKVDKPGFNTRVTINSIDSFGLTEYIVPSHADYVLMFLINMHSKK